MTTEPEIEWRWGVFAAVAMTVVVLYPQLNLWLARGATLRAGGVVPPAFVTATRALAEAYSVGLGSRVKGIRPEGEELTLVLRRGTEIRLGRPTEVGLKLTVASRVLRLVDSSTSYVDVSVPQRAVAD